LIGGRPDASSIVRMRSIVLDGVKTSARRLSQSVISVVNSQSLPTCMIAKACSGTGSPARFLCIVSNLSGGWTSSCATRTAEAVSGIATRSVGLNVGSPEPPDTPRPCGINGLSRGCRVCRVLLREEGP
jgi:hypothetical protein